MAVLAHMPRWHAQDLGGFSGHVARLFNLRQKVVKSAPSDLWEVLVNLASAAEGRGAWLTRGAETESAFPTPVFHRGHVDTLASRESVLVIGPAIAPALQLSVSWVHGARIDRAPSLTV